MKYTPSGTAMAKFRVAVRDPFRKDDAGKVQADFFDVVAWRTSAEFAAKYLEKGSPVALKGRIRQETWSDKEGATRSRVVINADDVESIGPNPNAPAQAPEAAKPAPKPAAKPAPPAPETEEPEYDPFAGDV